MTPMIRGIHATLYADLTDPSIDVQKLFKSRYEAEPFVDVMPTGPIRIRLVARTLVESLVIVQRRQQWSSWPLRTIGKRCRRSGNPKYEHNVGRRKRGSRRSTTRSIATSLRTDGGKKCSLLLSFVPIGHGGRGSLP